ncbi:MAG TPA: hypothetical protein VFI85_08090 [Methyloceanibacter sp.]|nr:hypothetical protein [Methyloceanibacter sp.]
MTISTPPVSDGPEWHPVHRANALLREALQNTTQSFEALEARYSVESLSNAIESVLQGPVRITYPTPLAARLDGLPFEENKIPGLAALMRPLQQAPGAPLAASRNDGDDGRGPVGQDDGLDDCSLAVWDDAEISLSLDGKAPLRADAPLHHELRPRQVHMQALKGDFQRRQRSASLLVAASIAAAILATIGGFVLAASLASPADAEQLDASRSTSVAWTKPVLAAAGAGFDFARIAANRAAKGEPLPLPAPQSAAALSSAPQTILAASGRQIALGSFLPPSHARYFMIRGLPPEATLSAGRQSGGGAWMVKGEYVPGLTLTLGQAAAGDYPVEVYMLESGDGPQARRSFVLRVASPDPAMAQAPAPNLAAAASSTPAMEDTTVPPEAAVLRARAMRLLGEGDIAAARMLLLHLAERGDGEAAYDLARTFDREMLAELGAKGVGGDPARARGWYERASQGGNAKAAERLKILASLAGTPSD